MKRKNEDSSSNPSTTDTSSNEPPTKKFKFLSKDKYTRFPIRTRAHANPLSDEATQYPESPLGVDWNSMYPTLASKLSETPRASILDVGCAYAGLLCSLSPLHPDKIMLGMEIRPRVVEYSQHRIQELREQSEQDVKNGALMVDHSDSTLALPGHNIWVIRCNVMKNLVNFIQKAQLERIFFCYPDPHWKKKKHRRRIISETLLSEYAYCLKKGGLIYAVSDVKELGDWMRDKLEKHPSFEALSSEEMDRDPYAQYVKDSSEDAVRSQKQKRDKHLCIFRRL